MRFDVLCRDLNVFEPHFLEASAGTGKTFAIEHLVTRLLIESDAPLLIEQILVVTFTRAATRELKQRIRLNLTRAKEELWHANPSADYLKVICEQGEKAVKSAIERLDAALICFDAAQIFTLHGFCHRILKEFAFEAGISFEVSDPDQKEHISLLEQMIKDHLKENVSAPQYSPAQINAVLKKKQSDPRKMVSGLIELASSSNEIAALPSFGEHLETFLKEVRALPEIDAAGFKADLSLLIPHYKQMTGEEIPAQIDMLAAILSSKECTQHQFDHLLMSDFFLEKMREDNQKVRAKFPERSSLSYPGLVERMRKTLLPPIDSAKDPSRTFLRLARDLQVKSRDLLETKEKFSPDALLLKVEEALKIPRFVERVRQKFRAAIIDEFQDTDPVQWNIFRQLFLSEMRAVCLVGDPKQSIYAFRNADVYVYLEAAKAMGESARKHLDTNFRSTAPLVSALNLLFSRAQGRWMDLPSCEESLEVIPVKAGGRLIADDAEAPVEFFVAVDKRGTHKKFPTSDMLENKVFPFLASEISRLHVENGIEYHDIAILIKDRFQGQDVIEYLKKCGIPASSKRGGSILDTDAFFALKEILAAVCAPFDMSKVKAALGGPVFAWSEEQLGGGPLLEAKATMQSLNQVLFEKGFGPFFQTLLGTGWGTSGTPLLQELFSRGDLPLYLDLRKLCELLIEEEIGRGLKGNACLSFLEEIATESHPDETRLKVSPQEEKGSVTVMTMHMSKGLEFDVVFALGIASRHPPSEQIAIKIAGRRVLSLMDPLDPASMLALEELDAEKMRQLYVALTRAKKRLYIPLMIEESKKGMEIGDASPVELFFARIAELAVDHASLYRIAENMDIDRATEILKSLSPLIHYRILQDAPEPNFKKTESLDCELISPSPMCLPTYDEQLLSFSYLAAKDHSIAVSATKPPQGAPLSPHTMPLGSDTGHLLHVLFEKIFKRRLHHPLNERSLTELIDEEIVFSPLEPWRPILLPWILELLIKPLNGFCLSDVPGEQLQQEMEFLFRTDRGMMKGFADLFFEFGGKYYLLDWKSNYLGPSDADYTQEKIAEAMQQNQYELQASIYADALERYVKLFDNRPFKECFGGAIYYFVRGKAAYHFIPESYSKLSS